VTHAAGLPALISRIGLRARRAIVGDNDLCQDIPRMIDAEPNLVTTSKSQEIVVDGYPFSIEIYRLGTEKTWSLEVVDHEGTSHVWNDLFRSDKDARHAAVHALESEGAIAFMRGDNVIPFRPG
jgi:hypothetical protein